MRNDASPRPPLALCGNTDATPLGPSYERRTEVQVRPAQSRAWLVLFILASASASSAGAVDAFEQNKRLGRGVNALGYDPLWRDRSKARFQADHFRLVHV